MTTAKKKKPSAKQLKAWAKLGRMAKRRAKEARAAKRAMAPKRVPAKRGKKNTTIVKAKRIDHLDVAKVHNRGRKPSTRRNAEHRDAQHPIHVRQYWQGRAGYKSQWQRAHEAGQRQLFGVKNPTLTDAQISELVKLTRALPSLKASALAWEKYEIIKESDAPRKLVNAARKAAHVAARRYERDLKALEKKYVANLKRTFPRRAATKHSNGSAAKLRREWSGKSGKVTNSYAPKGSGVKGTVIKMGELKKVYIKGRAPMTFPAGAAMLAYAPKASRRKDQMVVLGKGYKLHQVRRANPEGLEDLGEITQIEYIETKHQFGDTEPVTYFHKLGEEGGERPHAVINDEGLLLIEGGDYTITPEGIRD